MLYYNYLSCYDRRETLKLANRYLSMFEVKNVDTINLEDSQSWEADPKRMIKWYQRVVGVLK